MKVQKYAYFLYFYKNVLKKSTKFNLLRLLPLLMIIKPRNLCKKFMNRNFENKQNWLIRTDDLAGMLKNLHQNATDTAKNIDKIPPQPQCINLFQSAIYKRKYKEQYFGSVDIYGNAHLNDSEDEDEPLKGIAILDLNGMLMKESYFDWWDYSWKEGTKRINDKLHILGNDPNVLGVLIRVDSIGGSANGAETLATTVYEFKNRYKKPIWAHIDGAAYSAAYKIVSGADRIIVSGESSAVGSIGTMVQYYDDSKYLADLGIEPVEIYATLSKNKNKAWRDIKDGKMQAIIGELDKMNNIFINHVIKARGAKMGIAGKTAQDFTVDDAPAQITGETYMGKDAIAAGLVDEIATEEDTLVKMVKKLEKPQVIESGNIFGSLIV